MMTPTAAISAKIKVCMFDQYGTVVDMQKGLLVAPDMRSLASLLVP